MTARAWEWVDHLRTGGTTPWLDWQQEPAAADHAGGRLLPGAQQLELLRRLNLAGTPDPPLVERVLWASAPGRGRSDLELVGAVEPLSFGPAPVDPGALPAVAVLRVAVGLLAEDLHAMTPVPHPRPVRRLPRLRTYRLVGDPWIVDPLRRALAVRGRPPGGRGSRVVVVGTDLPTMLAHAWLARTFVDVAPSWSDFIGRARRRGRLPAGVDVAAVARKWADGVGAARVRVVLDPAQLGPLVGLRRGGVLPADVAPEAGELSRRIAGALTHLVPGPRRRHLLTDVLRPELELRSAGRLPRVPVKHRGWLTEEADRIRGELASGGYAVASDLDLLLPRWDTSATRPDPPAQMNAVLDLAVELLLTRWATYEWQPRS